MESQGNQTNLINSVFGDFNLVLHILSFLYKEANCPHEFLINTPIALHILSFKSLYYEFHKIPNLQIKSLPIQYLSSLSVFKWAITMGYSGDIKGNNNLLEYIIDLHKEQAIHFIDYIITTKSSNYFVIDQRYVESNYFLIDQIAEYAAQYGYIHLFEYIRLVKPIFSWFMFNHLCEFAAESGHLHILQWLRYHDPLCSYNTDICDAAAESGHLHILQWLRNQNPPCPWSHHTCHCAAQSGHVHVLQWLRSQNPPCPWSHDTCTIAAKCGHLHVLQWLRSQNPPCPWHMSDCLGVVTDPNIINWINTLIIDYVIFS